MVYGSTSSAVRLGVFFKLDEIMGPCRVWWQTGRAFFHRRWPWLWRIQCSLASHWSWVYQEDFLSSNWAAEPDSSIQAPLTQRETSPSHWQLKWGTCRDAIVLYIIKNEWRRTCCLQHSYRCVIMKISIWHGNPKWGCKISQLDCSSSCPWCFIRNAWHAKIRYRVRYLLPPTDQDRNVAQQHGQWDDEMRMDQNLKSEWKNVHYCAKVSGKNVKE